ncbi:hypothetical protein FH972_023171 [Carpinus fangiana]|uniref:Rab-GAP TBC domain-containing protein n=1 Tax=Carpinus fangiana TaxID=176857 RepID=A0A5N6KUW6_9ROSI|nr:hypothetical protein FH972_023171 [Carpinus fangiana]
MRLYRHLLPAGLLVLLPTASAFYLPGVAPTSYQRGDKVPLYVNHLTPSQSQADAQVRSALSWDYYDAPFHFCNPPEGPTQVSESLGSIIFGDRIQTSPFDLHMLENQTCKIIPGCGRQTFSGPDAAFVNERISESFNLNWLIDGLPAAGELMEDSVSGERYYSPGFALGNIFENGPVFNNRYEIYIDYHKAGEDQYRVVGVEVEPFSFASISEGEGEGLPDDGVCPEEGDRIVLNTDGGTSVVFAYSVYWRESETPFATRWDKYLHVFDPKIHWFSLINSAVIVVFLSAMVFVVLVRALKRDITRYNRLDSFVLDDMSGSNGHAELDDSVQEDSGWKLVHGDVFRPPKLPLVLSVLVGNGSQLFMMAGFTIVFALLGFLSPSNRGSLGSVMVLLYTLFGAVGGFVSSYTYKCLGGEDRWKQNVIITPVALPLLVFAVFFFLNFFLWVKGTSGAVPFTTMLVIILIWFVISVPLSVAGSWLAFRRPAIEAPVKTNQIPRQIPEAATASSGGISGWLNRPIPSMLLTGILPFGAIFVELYFIMNSLWSAKIYYMFGFLFVCYGLMVVTCATVTVLAIYFLLCGENYHWQWRAFFTSGSCAFYVFANALFFWMSRLSFGSFTGAVLYLGYSALISLMVFVLTGTIGFLASWVFVHRIYRSIKVATVVSGDLQALPFNIHPISQPFPPSGSGRAGAAAQAGAAATSRRDAGDPLSGSATRTSSSPSLAHDLKYGLTPHIICYISITASILVSSPALARSSYVPPELLQPAARVNRCNEVTAGAVALKRRLMNALESKVAPALVCAHQSLLVQPPYFKPQRLVTQGSIAGCALFVTLGPFYIRFHGNHDLSQSTCSFRRCDTRPTLERDSGLASSFASTVESLPPRNTTISGKVAIQLPVMAHSQQEIPSIVVHDEDERVQTPPPPLSPTLSRSSDTAAETAAAEAIQSARAATAAQLEQPADFQGIMTDIPTGKLDDPFSSEELSFSNRGSVLWSGDKAAAVLNGGRYSTSGHSVPEGSKNGHPAPDMYTDRAMSSEEIRLSHRVRSMYEYGDENAGTGWLNTHASATARQEDCSTPEQHEPVMDEDRPRTAQESLYASSVVVTRANSLLSSRRSSMIRRDPWESAGGIEDWRDVHGEDVDRYGFIRPRSRVLSGSSSVVSASTGPGSPETSHRAIHRPVTGSLATVAEASVGNDTPHGVLNHSRVSINGADSLRSPPRTKPHKRSSPSVLSTHSRRSSVSTNIFRRSRSVNRGRRWADTAGDMLSMEPGQSVLPFETEDSNSPEKAAKEREREVKWAKMAQLPRHVSSVTTAKDGHVVAIGGGQDFTFDTASPKLVSRTWKGIPDRWRAPAWYAFLTASAHRQAARTSSPFTSDAVLISSFHSLQEVPCSDDPQIDMDVPRTIGGHIMFRRRYRGGQRLMFRVLRALALFFPETGYVQGMATLAATLLCYYDEERAFVMGVRMWTCRGLAHLYEPGFGGLMDALDGFEKGGWLGGVGNGAVAKCLEDVGVVTGSYGTKWYLTLFAYSVPFAAQLRVWDVFMLLGAMQSTPSKSPSSIEKQASAPVPDLDVLHAVSAALLDGLQDVLLDADFENAMKVLTSPVPVGHEDILMEVARREYNARRKRGAR